MQSDRGDELSVRCFLSFFYGWSFGSKVSSISDGSRRWLSLEVEMTRLGGLSSGDGEEVRVSGVWNEYERKEVSSGYDERECIQSSEDLPEMVMTPTRKSLPAAVPRVALVPSYLWTAVLESMA